MAYVMEGVTDAKLAGLRASAVALVLVVETPARHIIQEFLGKLEVPFKGFLAYSHPEVDRIWGIYTRTILCSFR